MQTNLDANLKSRAVEANALEKFRANCWIVCRRPWRCRRDAMHARDNGGCRGVATLLVSVLKPERESMFVQRTIKYAHSLLARNRNIRDRQWQNPAKGLGTKRDERKRNAKRFRIRHIAFRITWNFDDSPVTWYAGMQILRLEQLFKCRVRFWQVRGGCDS